MDSLHNIKVFIQHNLSLRDLVFSINVIQRISQVVSVKGQNHDDGRFISTCLGNATCLEEFWECCYFSFYVAISLKI